MMDLIGGISVTLVVKAPNEKIADQTVECAPDWTIRKLKEHLSDVYPNRPVSWWGKQPDHEEERIIL